MKQYLVMLATLIGLAFAFNVPQFAFGAETAAPKGDCERVSCGDSHTAPATVKSGGSRLTVVVMGVRESARREPVGGMTSVPIGWYDFCKSSLHDGDCRVGKMRPVEIHFGEQFSYAEMDAVNRHVNAVVVPEPDQAHYGVTEFWAYPDDGFGDCEDYVLEKRRELIGYGWPRSALLITVLRQANGDGHAALTVVTDRGDLILDNLTDDIKPWSQTPYHYVKRQSAEDPNVWVDIQPDVPTASVR